MMDIEKISKPVDIIYKNAHVRGKRVVIYKPEHLSLKDTNINLKYIRISTVVEAVGNIYTLVGYFDERRYREYLEDSYINFNKASNSMAILSIRPRKII